MTAGVQSHPADRHVHRFFHDRNREASWMSRLVRWIKADRPLLLQIAIKCLALIAAIFASLTLIGLPFVFWGVREINQQREQAKNTKATAAKLEEIKEVIGPKRYHSFPLLDLHGRMGKTGYIDFLTADDLTSPVMKGRDRYSRPFITFKMQDTDTGQVFVQTMFQRYIDAPIWVYGGHMGYPGYGIFSGIEVGNKENCQRFANLLDGIDNRFVLLN